MPGIGADRALDQRQVAAELMDYALEADGMLRTKVVSPTMDLHLVADSRRPKWGDGLVDKDTMAG